MNKTNSSSSFESVLRRIHEGDADAVAEIWDVMGHDLRRRARTRLRQFGLSGTTESMDICNSVLLDLIRKGQFDLDEPAKFVGYVKTAIDNQVRDVLRNLSRQKRDFRRNENEPVCQLSLQADQTSPSIAMLRDEVMQRVKKQLGESGGLMVRLYLQNCSWIEMGAQLNISADNARMKWNRAVQLVREQLGAEE